MCITKAEVRLRDGGRIHGLVLSAVREVLLGNDLRRYAVPMNPVNEAPRIEMREKLADFFRQNPGEFWCVTDTIDPSRAECSFAA